MRITRRALLQGAGALALSVALFGAEAYAQKAVSQEELLKPGPLGDHVLGRPDAPVTIIEYASMTCSHCATFDVKTFPLLKERYIDAGKVRFIFREFPLDPLAAAAFMLARCLGDDKYFAAVHALFAQQETWVVKQPLPPLMSLAKQFGMSQQQFEQCLSNQKMLEQLEAERNRAAQLFGVSSTPTFFINGEIQRGALSIEELEKLLAPLLRS